MTASRDTARGVAAAATAYVLWGVVVVYWKLLGHVDAWEILAHRIVWSLAFVAPIVVALGRVPAVLAALSNARSLAALALSTVLISLNWGVFIWAVANGRILETSLGYYVNPLATILLGVALLGERLSPLRLAAFGLGAAGVAVQAWALGGLPWVSLVLPFSFALYGFVRKTIPVEAIDGLLVETLLAAPFAALYLILLAQDGSLAFLDVDRWTDALLVIAGPVTAIPLWLFAVGARGLRMSTLGFLQYATPTITFALGTFVYAEPMSALRLASFALIWAALALVVWDGLARERLTRPSRPPA